MRWLANSRTRKTAGSVGYRERDLEMFWGGGEWVEVCRPMFTCLPAGIPNPVSWRSSSPFLITRHRAATADISTNNHVALY